MSADKPEAKSRPPGRTGEVEAISAPPEPPAPPPKVFSADDLFRGLCLAHPEAQARDLATAIAADMKRPGSVWAVDNLLLIALLSSDHRRRAAEFLGLAEEAMSRELTRVRTFLVRRPT